MDKKFEQITVKEATMRLHVDKRTVHHMIERKDLNARMVTEAPRPYYLITVDDKFLAVEALKKEQDQSLN